MLRVSSDLLWSSITACQLLLKKSFAVLWFKLYPNYILHHIHSSCKNYSKLSTIRGTISESILVRIKSVACLHRQSSHFKEYFSDFDVSVVNARLFFICNYFLQIIQFSLVNIIIFHEWNLYFLLGFYIWEICPWHEIISIYPVPFWWDCVKTNILGITLFRERSTKLLC